MVTIIGSYISPYVRKVLVSLDLKGLDYEIDPIVPFYGNDAFTEISPVRRIPVLIDGDVKIPDSTVICEYLEDRYPLPALYPAAAASRARARWIEEYAGSRMGEVFIWRYFNQLVIKRFVWGERQDPEVVKRALEVEIPAILDYLESLLPEDGYLFGEISVADVSVATFFRNVQLTGTELDMGRWPATAAFVARLLDHPAFVGLRKFEEVSTRTPIPNHRDALREAGAPVAAASYFAAEPRRGILSL